MRKKLALLFLMKFSGLWLLNAEAQSQLSFEHYYTMAKASPATSMPVASYQSNNGFYAEGRYNYEDLNTFSFYMGRTFSKESTLSYSISPMAGAVIGQYNGGSIGANISLGYKNFYIYSQPQYTFSLAGAVNNFIYSWTDFTYSPLDWLSVGLSVQHTKLYQEKGFLENGLVVEAAYKKFTFPVYIFNPQSKDRTVFFGATFELSFKKKKVDEPKKSDTFHESYPVNFLATKPEGNTKATDIQPIDPVKPKEGVVKVKRVNVVMAINDADNNLKKSADTQTPIKPAIASTAVTPKATTIPQKGRIEIPTASKPEPKLVAGYSAKKDTIAINKPISPTEQNKVYFALVLGPFENESEALYLQNKLGLALNKYMIVFSESSKYKLRAAGFPNQKEAEIFSVNVLNQGCKAPAVVLQYTLKSVESVPLKNMSKPFEATQL